MNADDYFIKNGYLPNKKILTLDDISSGEYWNQSRINSSYYYQSPVYQYAKKIIAERGLKNVIDVGCGVGTKLSIIHKELPSVKFVGIDQKNAIDYCKKNHEFGKWYVDDFENPDASLTSLNADLVICSDVIEHLLNPDVLLNYIKSKISEGGYILLSTPERDLLRGKSCMISPNKFHVREWNYNELESYLKFNNFMIKDHFLQLPIKVGFDRIIFDEIVRRAVSFRPLKYNQVCLIQVI